jgi:hypothetical protein
MLVHGKHRPAEPGEQRRCVGPHPIRVHLCASVVPLSACFAARRTLLRETPVAPRQPEPHAPNHEAAGQLSRASPRASVRSGAAGAWEATPHAQRTASRDHPATSGFAVRQGRKDPMHQITRWSPGNQGPRRRPAGRVSAAQGPHASILRQITARSARARGGRTPCTNSRRSCAPLIGSIRVAVGKTLCTRTDQCCAPRVGPIRAAAAKTPCTNSVWCRCCQREPARAAAARTRCTGTPPHFDARHRPACVVTGITPCHPRLADEPDAQRGMLGGGGAWLRGTERHVRRRLATAADREPLPPRPTTPFWRGPLPVAHPVRQDPMHQRAA